MSAEKYWAPGKKLYLPVYWLEGEEEYYIDLVMDFAEHQLLTESEAEFNLSIFYGRDASWASVLNACQRYPMNAEKQVVLLKEAQHMKEFERIETYISSPLSSTILVIAYKGKNFDKRTKLYKTLQTKAEVLNSMKIKDAKIHEWIGDLCKSRGYSIQPKAVALIEELIGNDLSRIANEVEKLSVNLKGRKMIDDDDIELYIGISKEYNIFELQSAIARKDLAKAVMIIKYFEGNPKAAPLQVVLPSLYAHFSKVYAVFGLTDTSDAALRPMFYFNPVSLQQAKDVMKNYGYEGVEKLLLLLNHYNLKSVGIGDAGTPGASLMKEMVVKMIME